MCAGTAGTVGALRALVVTNMYPSAGRTRHSARSCATRWRRCGAGPASRSSSSRSRPARVATRAPCATLRRSSARERFDVVHAHFGLTAWPVLLARLGAPLVVTLHGNDLFHPRSNRITRAALPFTALPAAVSRAFSANVPGAGTTGAWPCSPSASTSIASAASRGRRRGARLGVDPEGPYLLFPHDPARPLKRFDRAQEVAGDTRLLIMGRVAPAEVPYWINAANAVLVPSQDEGFGLSVIEALACGVPAFGTPVGIHPVALAGIVGALCAAVRPRRLARRARTRTCGARIRASTGARAPSCSRPIAWPHGWSRRGESWSPSGWLPIPPGQRPKLGCSGPPYAPASMSGLFRRKRTRAAAAEESRTDPPAPSEPQDATTTAPGGYSLLADPAAPPPEGQPAPEQPTDPAGARAAAGSDARSAGGPRGRGAALAAAVHREPLAPAPPHPLPAPRARAAAARPRRPVYEIPACRAARRRTTRSSCTPRRSASPRSTPSSSRSRTASAPAIPRPSCGSRASAAVPDVRRAALERRAVLLGLRLAADRARRAARAGGGRADRDRAGRGGRCDGNGAPDRSVAADGRVASAESEEAAETERPTDASPSAESDEAAETERPTEVSPSAESDETAETEQPTEVSASGGVGPAG